MHARAAVVSICGVRESVARRLGRTCLLRWLRPQSTPGPAVVRRALCADVKFSVRCTDVKSENPWQNRSGRESNIYFA
eukprot:4873101-Prymnesium_polylepis.2